MPDDEGCGIRTQPNDGIGNLLWFARSSDWLLRDHLPPSFSSAAGEAIHHRSGDVAGGHDVDADVLRGVVESCRLGQSDHAVF